MTAPRHEDVVLGEREQTFLRAWFQWNLGDHSWLDVMLADLDDIDNVEDELRAEGVLE